MGMNDINSLAYKIQKCKGKVQGKKLFNEGDAERRIKDEFKNRRKSVGNRNFLRD